MPPVLIIIFNRPDKVRSLMKALEKVRPTRLFISADSPRPNRPEDIGNCAESRRIATEVSWPCEIKTNFSDTNLGCKLGVSSAITWFFSHVEEGIILEDDCIPNETFFQYVGDLLEKYNDAENVMHISGTTLLDRSDVSSPELSYHFSHIAHVWGWATWRRAWDKFDLNMPALDSEGTKTALSTNFNKRSHARFWLDLFRHVRDKGIDTWDAQWSYSILRSGGLSITPNMNMIQNIGFGTDATHTKESGKDLPNARQMKFPLNHPKIIEADRLADERLMYKVYDPKFLKKLLTKLKFIFGAK